jgi:radical SAM superfamily enzyme YgiQ (UPF0313 family)
MAHIGIIKVRTPHDVEWRTNWPLRQVLKTPGMAEHRRKLRDMEGKPFMSQLTLPYLAGLGIEECRRKKLGHTFEIAEDQPEFIDVERFDMLWITANTTNVPASYQLADRARAGGTRVVMGGVHPSLMVEEALGHCDAVVRGEAEPVLGRLLDDFEHGALQDVYRGGGRADLAGLPLPRWDLMPREAYRWIVPLQTSRGCRNACSFCSTTRMQGARRRHRPVEDIVREISFLKGSGIFTRGKIIFLTDNNIAYDDRHGGVEKAFELFNGLRPLDIRWAGQAEIGIAEEPRLLRLAAESGCQTLLIGFESLSQESLDRVGKARSLVGTYKRNIERIHECGINIIGCFVFGFDNEGPDVFERTEEFIQNNIDIPQLAILTPFPGTVLFKDMSRSGRLLHHDWSKYDITHVVFRPEGMTPRELEEGYCRLSERLYGYMPVLFRAARHVARRTLANFHGLSPVGRFASVLWPNLIYKELSLVGR